jgi:hypothetical protein
VIVIGILIGEPEAKGMKPKLSLRTGDHSPAIMLEIVHSISEAL